MCASCKRRDRAFANRTRECLYRLRFGAYQHSYLKVFAIFLDYAFETIVGIEAQCLS
jgi:hypothetical protein